MMDLAGASVVVTGASSGIGRATAVAFARRGARLTLAARRDEVLDEVAQECRDLGAEAIAVETDVADPEAMTRLARAAQGAFGRIDVWVNNAGVGVVGAYADVPLDLHRQVIETNLLGAMHGAHVALPIFLSQSCGLLVNNVSMGALTPMPFAAAYTASKFGLRGMTASLRQEMQGYPDIHVCAVFPSIIDTPGIQHGANLSGHRIDPGPYLYAPERVAEAIVGLVRHPRAEIPVGFPAGVARFAYGVAPIPTERVVDLVPRRAMERASLAPHVEGAVRRPIALGQKASGGLRARKRMPDATVINSVVIAAGGAAVLLGGLAWLSRQQRI